MVEKINLNPFTNQSLTAEQIAELDSNNDGIVSDLEITLKWDWLKEQSSDAESELNCNSTILNVTVENKEGFLEQAAIMFDLYTENYFANNLSITEADRERIMSLMTTNYNEFITSYLTENTTGPYNMAEISTLFGQKMNEKLQANTNAINSVNSQINNYTKKLNENKSTMMSMAYTASRNNYITEAEWNKVKSNMVSYIIGMLMTDNIDEDFLKQLNSKYTKDSDYKEAIKLIKELKNSNDPIKMQELLSQIQEKITSFVTNVGKEKAIDCVNEYACSEGEKAIEEILNTYIDKYLEEMLTEQMTENEKAMAKEFVENCKEKYLSQIVENGTFDTISQDQLISGFTDYITTQSVKNIEIKTDLYTQSTEIDKAYETLIKTNDQAKENGFIAEDERKNIALAAKIFIQNQLLSGMQNIELLEKLGESSAVTKMRTLVTQIWKEQDPDKLAELQKQLDELISSTLDKHTGDELVASIEHLKPVEIVGLTKDKAAHNSTIATEYAAGASRSTSRGKQNESRLKEIQEMARADLNAYAEALKAELKAELGSAYDEAEIQKYINDAIEDTISLFTRNVVRKNQHGDYTTGIDRKGFVFAKRSCTSKGRYVYNVTALINTFVDFFNSESKSKNEAKIDNSRATYDRENVISASLGNDYDRNKSKKIYGHKSDENTYAKIIEQARADLKLVAEQIKTSLLAEGVPIDMSKVDQWLDDLIMETIQDMKNAFQYCHPNGKNTGSKIGISSSMVGSAGAAIGTIVGTEALTAAATAAAGAAASATSASTAATAAWFAASQAVVNGTGTMAAVDAAYGASVTAAATATSVSGTAASIAAASSAVPIVGWGVAAVALTVSILGMTTNIFGATYGQHNSEAGFYFERKSHSKSGNWGYDTATLVNVFLSKVDAKIAEEKELYKNKNNPNA